MEQCGLPVASSLSSSSMRDGGVPSLPHSDACVVRALEQYALQSCATTVVVRDGTRTRAARTLSPSLRARAHATTAAAAALSSSLPSTAASSAAPLHAVLLPQTTSTAAAAVAHTRTFAHDGGDDKACAGVAADAAAMSRSDLRSGDANDDDARCRARLAGRVTALLTRHICDEVRARLQQLQQQPRLLPALSLSPGMQSPSLSLSSTRSDGASAPPPPSSSPVHTQQADDVWRHAQQQQQRCTSSRRVRRVAAQRSDTSMHGRAATIIAANTTTSAATAASAQRTPVVTVATSSSSADAAVVTTTDVASDATAARRRRLERVSESLGRLVAHVDKRVRAADDATGARSDDSRATARPMTSTYDGSSSDDDRNVDDDAHAHAQQQSQPAYACRVHDDASASSAVELVRVHRLRGIAQHNRGLFAGLSGKRSSAAACARALVTDDDDAMRVRTALWYALHYGTTPPAFSPPRGDHYHHHHHHNNNNADNDDDDAAQMMAAMVTPVSVAGVPLHTSTQAATATTQATTTTTTTMETARRTRHTQHALRTYAVGGQTFFAWCSGTTTDDAAASWHGNADGDDDDRVDVVAEVARIMRARYGAALGARDRAEARARVAARRRRAKLRSEAAFASPRHETAAAAARHVVASTDDGDAAADAHDASSSLLAIDSTPIDGVRYVPHVGFVDAAGKPMTLSRETAAFFRAQLPHDADARDATDEHSDDDDDARRSDSDSDSDEALRRRALAATRAATRSSSPVQYNNNMSGSAVASTAAAVDASAARPSTNVPRHDAYSQHYAHARPHSSSGGHTATTLDAASSSASASSSSSMLSSTQHTHAFASLSVTAVPLPHGMSASSATPARVADNVHNTHSATPVRAPRVRHVAASDTAAVIAAADDDAAAAVATTTTTPLPTPRVAAEHDDKDNAAAAPDTPLQTSLTVSPPAAAADESLHATPHATPHASSSSSSSLSSSSHEAAGADGTAAEVTLSSPPKPRAMLQRLLADEDNLLDLPMFLYATPHDADDGTAQRVGGGDTADARASRAADENDNDEKGSADGDDAIVGFTVTDAQLCAKFRTEAEAHVATLVDERDRLRRAVQAQRATIAAFAHDIHHLSHGDEGAALSSDAFALALTRDVDAYARAHGLTWHLLGVPVDAATAAGNEQGSDAHDNNNDHDNTTSSNNNNNNNNNNNDNVHDDDDVTVSAGYLRQLAHGKVPTRDVACRVTEDDLGYVNDAAQTSEMAMTELYTHERGLQRSIRLATIAVANMMSFHASLELESTCRHCFCVFARPRTLWPCGHTFCERCLAELYNGADELVCVECGSVCDVGYTPNLSAEAVANYQVVQPDVMGGGGGGSYAFSSSSSTAAATSGASAVTSLYKSSSNNKVHTIEAVLRQLLNDLLAIQTQL